jgi:hypothetical protein
MTTQPAYPVHPAGDVPGLPAVSATNQRTRRRKLFVEDKKRRRKKRPATSSEEEPTADPSQQPADQDDAAEGHVDCLA